MPYFKTSFKTKDTARRGPSDHKRHQFGRKLIDVFGRQTHEGEFPVYFNAKGETSSKPISWHTTVLIFGIDDHGWPYVRVTGNQSGWQLNGQQVKASDSWLNYLDISATSRGDLLTNASLDAKFSFQTKGQNQTQIFYVCWSPLKGESGVNPLVHP